MSNEYDDLTSISFTCRKGAYFDAAFQGSQVVTIDFLRKKFCQSIYSESFFDNEHPLYIRETSIPRRIANELYALAVNGDCQQWGERGPGEVEADWLLSLTYGETEYTAHGWGSGPEKSRPLVEQLEEWFDTDYPMMLFDGWVPSEAEQKGLKGVYLQMMRSQAAYLGLSERSQRSEANEKKNRYKKEIFFVAADEVVQKLVKRQEFTGEPDYEMVEFIGTFLCDYQMRLDGFREDITENAYFYGFDRLAKVVLSFDTIQKKDFFQMITDALKLATNGQRALIEKEMIPVFMENLRQGTIDCSNVLQHPAFVKLKNSYLSDAEKETPLEAETRSEFAEMVLYEGADVAVADIFEWLPMFDTTLDEDRQAFQEELAHTAISELGYDPQYWDADDFDFLGDLVFEGMLDRHGLTLEEGIQAAGCVFLTLNFLGDYPREEQVIPLVKGLLEGYNKFLAEEEQEPIVIPPDEVLQTTITQNESKEIQTMAKQLMIANRDYAVKSRANLRTAGGKDQEAPVVSARSAQITQLEEYLKKKSKKKKKR